MYQESAVRVQSATSSSSKRGRALTESQFHVAMRVVDFPRVYHISSELLESDIEAESKDERHSANIRGGKEEKRRGVAESEV